METGIENIALSIHLIRGQKVMLDRDLAKLYGVETRALKQAVRRNIQRFPEDFMFELDNNEIEEMVSQNVIRSKSFFGGAMPMAFTEQGVAMLSSVLKSETAIKVNIAIIRTFVKLRKAIADNEEIFRRLDEHDEKIDSIILAIGRLLEEKENNKEIKPVGYKTYN